jgi:hypothetical protein
MLWLTPEFCSLDHMIETTRAVLEHNIVEEEALLSFEAPRE